MKFTADREALADAVGWVAQVIPRNPVNAAVSGVRLTLDGSTLTLEATDYDTSHRAALDVLGADDGEALVPGFLLRDLTAALSKREDVTLAADDGELTISSGRSTYRIRLLRVEDFPAALAVNRKSKAATSVGETDADALRRAVGSVIHLIDEDAPEAVRGLRLEADASELTMVGAQTTAIGIARAPITRRGKVALEAQVPAGVFSKAVRGLAGAVKISHSEGVVELADASRCVTFRTYSSEFVTWRQLLRDESPYQVDIAAPELADAVRRAAITAGDKDTAAVFLHFDTDGIEVSARDDEQVASGVEILDADGIESAATVKLAVHLLAPALATFTGRVRVGMIPDAVKSVVLTSLENEPVQHIVMPRRK